MHGSTPSTKSAKTPRSGSRPSSAPTHRALRTWRPSKDIGVPAGEVGFECEVVQPQSGRYKTVYVHIPAEQVLALLKLCRYAAAQQRSKAMT